MTKAHSVSRFVKIEHTLFSLPLIFSGVVLASDGFPSLKLFLLILVGATGARTAAMAMNRIIDREIDKRNPRTASRELPSGRLSLWEAVAILIAGLAIYLTSAAAISVFCLILSPLPLIVFMVYPYMKRFTHYAHFGVGLGLAMAPLGGWFAVRGSFEGVWPGLLLSLFTVCWVAGFDIIYSTLDEEFDRNEKLHSFSARFGRVKALRYSGYLHTAAFLTLGALFVLELRALIAIPFLLLSGYLLFLEHRSADDVELAFFKINLVVGFAVFAMVLAGVYFA